VPVRDAGAMVVGVLVLRRAAAAAIS